MISDIKHSVLNVVARSAMRKRHGPIGLALGDERLNLIQMEQGASGPRIRAALSIPYPDSRAVAIASPKAFRAVVRAALKAGRFIGKDVVTCMPPDQVRIWLTNYRMTNDRSEAATIMALAMERLQGAADEWIVDYIPVRRDSVDAVEREAILTCARREHVLEHLQFLESAGLEVQALEVGPVAVQRLMAAVAASTTEENLLTVNFGRERVFLTVFAGRRLMVERVSKLGEHTLLRRLARDLQMNTDEARTLFYRYGLMPVSGRLRSADKRSDHDAEIAAVISSILKPCLMELAEEVQKVVVYTASRLRGAAVDHVYLLGSVTRWPGVAETLNQMLALPVDVLDPLAAFTTRADVNAPAMPAVTAGLSLATGNALRGLVSGG